MSNVEVDQSGRMEMSGETMVTASNGFTVTVRVTARVKQEVRQVLLERGVKPRMVMIRMFVGAIVLAIHAHLSRSAKVPSTLSFATEGRPFGLSLRTKPRPDFVWSYCPQSGRGRPLAAVLAYEAAIKSLLLDRIRAPECEFLRESIMITRVGKKSPAHRAAIRVTRRQAKADKTPSAEELLEVC